MRKLLSIFTILAAVMLTTSCQKELPDVVKIIDVSQGDKTPSSTSEEKYLRVSAESLSFTSPAGSLSFTITSNTSWSIKSDQDWCMVSSSSGSGNGTIIVNVIENTSTFSRSATITISSNDAVSVKVNVTQAGANLDLQLNKDNMLFTAAAGSDTFTITSNTSWSITSDQTWCTVSTSSGSKNGTISVTVSENKSKDSRLATIIVRADDLRRTIMVTQAGTPIEDMSTRSFTVNDVSFNMIRVDGGTFTMGATSEQVKDAWEDEFPTHRVTLTTYFLGETEVTQKLWKAVMGSNPSYFNGDEIPVEQVSWNDCQIFITKLNAATGQNFRLPTEAEWEFAARGGNRSLGCKFAGSNNIDNVAWYGGHSDRMTHNVAQKLPNELGLYDMSGNVWEWCQDRYGSYSSSSQTNPTGPESGSDCVTRGGGWHDGMGHCRVSARSIGTPDYYSNSLGLRLALQ